MAPVAPSAQQPNTASGPSGTSVGAARARWTIDDTFKVSVHVVPVGVCGDSDHNRLQLKPLS